MHHTSREQRGLAIADNGRVQLGPKGWVVRSQSERGRKYLVSLDRQHCNCQDFEIRNTPLSGATEPCKHVWAAQITVERAIARVTDKPGLAKAKRRKRNWPAYNAAQGKEGALVRHLLTELCAGVQQEPRKAKGRPRLPLGDVIHGLALRTYYGLSGRRSDSVLRDAEAKGELSVLPSYNSLFRRAGDDITYTTLQRLISESAKPLMAVEDHLAIDSSGFAAGHSVSWHDAKWGRTTERRGYVKLHAMCGTTTQIVTAAEVTHQDRADCPELSNLLTQTTAAGFAPEHISADKAYLSRANVDLIAATNAQAWIPFKVNSNDRGSATWRKAYAAFMYHREAWLESYRKRSAVEGLFSALKRKYGASVRTRKLATQRTEVLLRVLCFNLSVVAREILRLGIAPDFGTVQV